VLFNSFEFLFIFFPLIALGFHAVKYLNKINTTQYLAIISLACYYYWAKESLLLLLLSILFNFKIGKYFSVINSYFNKKALLIFGITVNLLGLSYYKYFGFLIENLNIFIDSGFFIEKKDIPLGISFFTFTQIAYLLDTFNGKAREYELLPYSLLVTYFPHIAAGPILHHRDLLPQFEHGFKKQIYDWSGYRIGFILVVIGLVKKLIIADQISPYVNLVFDGSSIQNPTIIYAWLGSIAFTLQLYFDFSGYTDIALGFSLLFGVIMPLNFRSPLQSKSIIDFWQNWHISLTRYIGEYIYNPLAITMSRKFFGSSPSIELVFTLITPIFLTFLIVGIWHGAGWNFVAFGVIHGVFMTINHIWRRQPFGEISILPAIIKNIFNRTLTFICIVVGFVMFRSNSFEEAIRIYAGMLGFNGVYEPALNFNATYIERLFYGAWEQRLTEGLTSSYSFILILSSLFITQFLPGSHRLFDKSPGKIWTIIAGTRIGACFTTLLMILAVIQLGKPSPFLYANF